MELWQKILMAVMGITILFFLFPGIKASMERSKNAEEKHWGTALLLAVVLIAFVVFLVSTLQ